MTLGQRIREQRLRLGLEAPEAARRAGLNPSYWWRLERDQHDPGYSRLCRVAAALDCSVGTLAGETSPPQLTPIRRRWLELLDVVPAGMVEDAFAMVARLGAATIADAVDSLDPLAAMIRPGAWRPATAGIA
jgi:XRE family transcriptional regulator of biofilm formation